MKKTVLFICVHNSGRSQMAEAFFNRLVQGKAQAISAGTEPADKVNPVVVEAMREVGLDISQNKPKALTLEMVEQAARTITMGCGSDAACPVTLTETEEWKLDDPEKKTLAEVRDIRDEIKTRVEQLIEDIQLS